MLEELLPAYAGLLIFIEHFLDEIDEFWRPIMTFRDL
jgi:hypothetical protein